MSSRKRKGQTSWLKEKPRKEYEVWLTLKILTPDKSQENMAIGEVLYVKARNKATAARFAKVLASRLFAVKVDSVDELPSGDKE